MSIFTFTKALLISAEAHEGVLDKRGDEYIKHPLHLAYKLKSLGYGDAYQIVALLHDTVEDTEWTLDMLRLQGATSEVLEALELMTHVVDENSIMNYLKTTYGEKDSLLNYTNEQIDDAREEEYLSSIIKLSTNNIARVVKMEDLKHNSTIHRNIMDDNNRIKCGKRLIKYTRAYNILVEIQNKLDNQ